MRCLLARLFGWQLVHLENTCDEIVRRIRWTAEGERYCVYFGSHLIWIDRPACGWLVTPLNFTREAAPPLKLVGRQDGDAA